MVKRRREEAHIQEMYDLGQRNVETITNARGWCKHLQIEMTSYGMLAEMSGLPIGSHDVTCPHAEHSIGGMNLPMILPEFLIQNCRNCPSHTPNGDTEWGERVISGDETRAKAREERERSVEAQLREIRESRGKLARKPASFAERSWRSLTSFWPGLTGVDRG